ncbi:ccg-8-like clock controled protein [Niveomyces insectorum RCEF 264]|uniref:Ccg-8-like clock controled protein n=1 Tax=Niveomyces insectorum RCEF 264 TaxID=1081102 RepID=A0A167NFQ3_9HYPO|nr:ccg-8-like clock controled protein [Niveomyces insectorum RCEF 264]
MDFDSDSTNTGAGGTPSPDQHRDDRAGSVSLDDPDVRLAAEALGDLRADFVSSPSNRSSRFSAVSSTTPSGPEPLLSLLTTSHPLLAKTIEGTTSAYNNSKNFSPKFKSGVEYVEGCLTPIGNTLGSVSRVTGVEGGVRWFLSGGRKQRLRASPANAETGKSGYHKRRKVNSSGQRTIGFSGSPELQSCAVKSTDLYTSARSDIAVDGDTLGLTDERRLSMSTIETLPAYDDHTSPAYTESDGLQQRNSTTDNNNLAQRVSTPNAWQSRLIMSTSGLSIAMSEESLRSLKFCLNWLRWANDHIGRVISALKSALEQYESVSFENSDDARRQTNVITANTDDSQIASRSELAARIATLKGDVLQTLRGVIDTVSKYAGGALPDNAKVLVRRHLTSLPQRFRLATSVDLSNPGTETSSSDAEVKEGAQRVLVLAKEGLDMMSQVSGVLDGTIVSAEEWCERLGKKKRDERGLKANHAVDGSYVSTESSVDSAMK